MRLQTGAAVLAALAVALQPGQAAAEKADKDKPTHIEANRMSSDDTRRLSIFEGNVVLTKGTIVIRADRIVVRQDAEGFQQSTATGAPARFRQKGDPKGDKEGVWTDGEALRMVMDDRNEQIELFDRAYVKRDEDEVRGEYIFIDQRAEFFKVTPGKDGPVPGSDNRVRVVIQPKNKPEDATKPPAGAPAKPPATLLAPQAVTPAKPTALPTAPPADPARK